MTGRLPCLAALIAACTAPPPPAADPGPTPQVVLDLEKPWTLVAQSNDEIAVRLADSPHGARIWLRPAGGRVPGVSPVHGGRTLEVEDVGQTWPLVAFAYPEIPVGHVEVRTQGMDLLVRASGPPLRVFSERADAPEDPVITWVRLRPRGADWRVVVDGLGTVSYPAEGLAVHRRDEGGWTLRGAAGTVEGDSEAPATHSRLGASRWSLDTTPSLQAVQPYPRTAFTWTPPAVSP